MTQTYAVKDTKMAHRPYRYAQCGLDDVYLLNGYRRHKTTYGGGGGGENTEALHEAIAQHLCFHKAFSAARNSVSCASGWI